MCAFYLVTECLALLQAAHFLRLVCFIYRIFRSVSLQSFSLCLINLYSRSFFSLQAAYLLRLACFIYRTSRSVLFQNISLCLISLCPGYFTCGRDAACVPSVQSILLFGIILVFNFLADSLQFFCASFFFLDETRASCVRSFSFHLSVLFINMTDFSSDVCLFTYC